MIQNDDEKFAKLNMLDEHGHRKLPIPAEVQGIWKNRRLVLQTILIILFFLLPWIKVGDKQAILIDISHREFAFLGLSLYSHDAPLLFFLIFGSAIGLGLLTALLGRVWCGWACPQTVFIERIYRQIEIWIEGNYRQRRQMRDQELNLKNLIKISLKWFLYFLLSFLIAKSFFAYFRFDNQAIVLLFSAVLTWNFGWFREQFCLIVCPYGKVQSLLMDSQSVTVMYDTNRKDCVNCGKCALVCPTGIDIRNGLQMECIGCTACIDACDSIMDKIKKPRGLIRYKSLFDRVHWWRPRVLVYGALTSVSFVALFAMGLSHTDERFVILRGRTTPFLVTEVNQEKMILNQYILRFENRGDKDVEVRLSADGAAQLQISQNPFIVPKGKKLDFPFFLLVPLVDWPSSGDMSVDLKLSENGKITTKNVKLIGPERSN